MQFLQEHFLQQDNDECNFEIQGMSFQMLFELPYRSTVGVLNKVFYLYTSLNVFRLYTELPTLSTNINEKLRYYCTVLYVQPWL